MKLGILTTQNQLNYGAVLQAYALSSLLREVLPTTEVETVNYHLFKHNADLLGEPLVELARLSRRAVLKRLYIRLLFPATMALHRKRRVATQLFLKTYSMNGVKEYCEPHHLWKNNPYDLFVVGSDQVWRYKSRAHYFCLLQGISDKTVQRIAYAASLGWTKLPEEYRDEYTSALKRFDAVSIREPSGAETMQKILSDDKIVESCLDPTLLFGRHRWANFMATVSASDAKIDQYAFVYWLADLSLLEEIFKGLHVKGFRRIVLVAPWYMKMVDGSPRLIESFRNRVKKEYGVSWKVDAGPVEFLRLLAKSAFVVANSFHAMMFSMIFHKPARIYVKVNGPRDPMAPRLLDFAERYDIDGVVYEGVEGHCDFASSPSLDFDAIWRRIEPDRRHSMTFLLDALKQCGVPVSSTVDEVL